MRPFTQKLLPLLALVMLAGCFKDKVTRTYTILTPVYREKNEVLADVKPMAAKPLVNPGKIYVYENYLFVNEVNEGVHIIENSNPKAPVNKAFITIPGNVDIAVKGHSLYADIYTDMLTLDIADPLSATITSIARDVFPERSYGNGFIADSNKYIVDWNRKDTIVPYNDEGCFNCGIVFTSDLLFFNSSTKATTPVGIAGSMARFTIINNYMYAVGINDLNVFNLNEPATPVFEKTVGIGFDIETVFPFKDKLFIGASSGIYIYDISTASNPSYVGSFVHMRSCDPVVTDGDYAYVTLRTGSVCGGILESRLEVLDVKQMNSPKLVATYTLSNPYGLGKDGNLLWICDGEAGLKMFDASSPAAIRLKKTYNNVEPFDVIPYNGKLIVSAKEGIIQYDYSNPDKMIELSRLKK